MKTLITLLALSATSFAQIKTVPVTIADPHGGTSENYKKVVTIESVLQYAEECYNDSTKARMRKVIVEGETFEVQCQREEYFSGEAGLCYDKYVHRQPTFEGFINYLTKPKK